MKTLTAVNSLNIKRVREFQLVFCLQIGAPAGNKKELEIVNSTLDLSVFNP